MRFLPFLVLFFVGLLSLGCEEPCTDCESENSSVPGDQQGGKSLSEQEDGAGLYYPLPLGPDATVGAGSAEEQPREVYVGLNEGNAGGGSQGASSGGGSDQPVKVGTQVCKDILSCMRDCLDSPTGNNEDCESLCLGKGTLEAQELYAAIQACVEVSGCSNDDAACKASFCSGQLDACIVDGVTGDGNNPGGVSSGDSGGEEEGTSGGSGEAERGSEGGQAGPGDGDGQGQGSEEGGGDTPAPPAGSCLGYCGSGAPEGCYCDDSCADFGDCCSNVCQVCPSLVTCGGSGEGSEGTDAPDDGSGEVELIGSCDGFCEEAPPDGNCFCDQICENFGDCCEDRCDFCPDIGSCAP